MKPPVRLLGALIVIATTSTLVLTVPGLSASASGLRSSGATLGYSCKHVTGTLTFNPALKQNGTHPETISGSFSFSGCSSIAKGGGTFTAKARITPPGISFVENSCPLYLAATPKVSIQVNYTHEPPPAQSTFTGKMSKIQGLTLSTSGIALTGKVSGSYPSSTAKGSLIFDKGEFGILAACDSSTGLKSLTIKSGGLENW